MKKRFWLAFVIAVLAGTGLHFLYDVCPAPLVGLFAPVNESVWEHLKLFFWPTLAAAFVLTRKNEDGQRAWSGWLLAELVMPVLCMGVFYMLSCGFGVEALWVDIALYVLVMAAGFGIAYWQTATGHGAWCAGVLVIAVGLYGAALICLRLRRRNCRGLWDEAGDQWSPAKGSLVQRELSAARLTEGLSSGYLL